MSNLSRYWKSYCRALQTSLSTIIECGGSIFTFKVNDRMSYTSDLKT